MSDDPNINVQETIVYYGLLELAIRYNYAVWKNYGTLIYHGNRPCGVVMPIFDQ